MALLSPRLVRATPMGGMRGRRQSRLLASTVVAGDGAATVGKAEQGEGAGIRWGTTKLQGLRDEMEDEILLLPSSSSNSNSNSLLSDGFSFAAVLDGHAGFSAVQFLRDELYKECAAALQGGTVLSTKNLDNIRDSIQRAFATVDTKLSTWLEQIEKEDYSGATATMMFLSNDLLVVSHLGDSCLVISRNGRAEVLTNFHRPYGSSRASLEEVKRIRAAGGWIVDGRICGDISVSRAFGDIRFKTRKNEMLVKGVEEGRWTEKFISRVQFKGDLINSSPDITLVELGPDVELILLASDGLWDYIKSSDAVAFVRDQLRQHGDVQLACEALGQAALDRRSQDNISIVIADLGRTNWQELPVQRPGLFYELTQAFATLGVVSIGIWISSFLLVQ